MRLHFRNEKKTPRLCIKTTTNYVFFITKATDSNYMAYTDYTAYSIVVQLYSHKLVCLSRS